MAFTTKAPKSCLKLLYQKVVKLFTWLYMLLCRLKAEPGYLIPQVLIISSLALHTPFIAVPGRENNYPVWKKVKGVALFVVTLQNFGIFLRSVLILSLAFHDDMKFVTPQGITIDLCGYVTLLISFLAISLVNWELYVDADGLVAWYNDMSRRKIFAKVGTKNLGHTEMWRDGG